MEWKGREIEVFIVGDKGMDPWDYFEVDSVLVVNKHNFGASNKDNILKVQRSNYYPFCFLIGTGATDGCINRIFAVDSDGNIISELSIVSEDNTDMVIKDFCFEQGDTVNIVDVLAYVPQEARADGTADRAKPEIIRYKLTGAIRNNIAKKVKFREYERIKMPAYLYSTESFKFLSNGLYMMYKRYPCEAAAGDGNIEYRLNCWYTSGATRGGWLPFTAGDTVSRGVKQFIREDKGKYYLTQSGNSTLYEFSINGKGILAPMDSVKFLFSLREKEVTDGKKDNKEIQIDELSDVFSYSGNNDLLLYFTYNHYKYVALCNQKTGKSDCYIAEKSLGGFMPMYSDGDVICFSLSSDEIQKIVNEKNKISYRDKFKKLAFVKPGDNVLLFVKKKKLLAK